MSGVSTSGRRRVAVIGGGIAGLSVAAALNPARFEVTLYEAQPERVTGAALGVWPSARRALQRIGAWHGLADASDLADDSDKVIAGSLFDIEGKQLIRAKISGLKMVERPRLLAALQDAVPDSVRVLTREITDPAGLEADLVIGADGVRSRVRPLVAGRGAARVATPYLALRGIRPAPEPQHFGEYWGPRRQFGLAPLGTDRAYWYAAFCSPGEPEPLDPSATVTQARTLYASAAPIIRETLAAAGPDTLATRMWVAPAMLRYRRDRYVLIGDAAHASLPNLGRGACDAILDGVTLAETLNAGRPVSLWGCRRMPFTQAARLVASSAMRMGVLDRGRVPRDRLLELAGRIG